MKKGMIPIVLGTAVTTAGIALDVNQNKRNKFNKKDYKKYPKTILTDLKICKKNKVDYVYLPQEKDIYPEKKIIIKNKIHYFKNFLE